MAELNQPIERGRGGGGGAGSAPVTVHVVSHTHWDREWYLSAARFRQQLVALVDELIDDPPPAGSSFLLDGQMVAIEDYLDVRPERAAALTVMLANGLLEAGPWFVLADELIPGGEALVRNLLAGRRALARLGASAPPVLYSPDSFGHPAMFPVLAAGFGLPLVVLSRGFGGARWPEGDAFRWIAPDGSEAMLYHLSQKGYDIGENLPTTLDAARERWRSIREDIVARSRLGTVLLPNGADHHARQRDLVAALALLADAALPDNAQASSLGAFATDAVARAAAHELPTVHGELRDSYGYMWTLQGTFATRAHQKRRNAQAERLLVRDAEPWVALARRRGAASRAPLVNAAWRSLLLCHPHDTLCGCSTDEVARAMDARLDEAHTQGAGLRDDALLDLIGHDRDIARVSRGAWNPMVVVRNAAARTRGGVAIILVTSFVSDVKVGANASPGAVETAKAVVPALGGIASAQVLTRALVHERTESPRHYPDDDVVQAAEIAAWIPEVRGYGVRCFPHQVRARRTAPPNPASAKDRTITNGIVTLRVGEDGRVAFEDAGTGRSVDDLLRWTSESDLGDLYTPSPRGTKFEARFRGAKVLHKGPVRAAVETRWSFGAGRERIDARVELIVDADARFVRLHIDGANGVADHRLRLGIATDMRNARVFADAMFGSVERNPIIVPPVDAAIEIPPATAPLHRYVSLFSDSAGATVYTDGLGEYEADANGTVFVTLVRSVGELSRNDLPERNGHAGWPTPTPEAQCGGPFGAELALLFHGARTPAVIDEIERTADDVLLPLTGASLRSALTLPQPIAGVELEGTGLACSAIKQSEDGGWLVLRCVNLTDDAQDGAWTLGVAVSEAVLARLDETPIVPMPVSGNRIAFTAPRRAVVTILVR